VFCAKAATVRQAAARAASHAPRRGVDDITVRSSPVDGPVRMATSRSRCHAVLHLGHADHLLPGNDVVALSSLSVLHCVCFSTVGTQPRGRFLRRDQKALKPTSAGGAQLDAYLHRAASAVCSASGMPLALSRPCGEGKLTSSLVVLACAKCASRKAAHGATIRGLPNWAAPTPLSGHQPQAAQVSRPRFSRAGSTR
jgi:hypothetical protein